MTHQTEQIPQVSLDDLQYFWMPSGLPCFIADRDNICDIVEDIGFNIYYLFANKKTTKTIQNNSNNNNSKVAYNVSSPTQVVTYNNTLFKVINNFVGRVVQASTDELPETFFLAEETCEYNMPEIPHVLVEKMDQFFRLVYSQHGTESIVLLTYDMNSNGPEGWGVLVPEQSNTPAHCKYDADSVAAIKPDNVLIVGSVHSHPEMSAYASGTDHADQADFDGLHITYGWQKSVNNGATQYHIELQMAGTAYSLKVEDVFESYTLQKQPDPDVVEWSGKVKKAHPPIAGGIHTPAFPPAPYNQQDQLQKTTSYKNGIQPTEVGAATTRHPNQSWNAMIADLETNAIVIVEAEEHISTTTVCPACDYDYDTTDFNSGACCVCDVAIVLNSDSIFRIAEKYSKYCEQRGLDPSTTIPYLYGENEKNEMYLMKLNIEQEIFDIHTYNYISDYNGKDSDYISLIEEKNNSFNYEYDGTTTICCNVPMDKFVTDCVCETPILYEDLTRFENEIIDFEIYDNKTDCIECVHYHNPSCPAFRYMLTEHTKDNSFDLLKLKETIIPCQNYESIYIYSTEGGRYDW